MLIRARVTIASVLSYLVNYVGPSVVHYTPPTSNPYPKIKYTIYRSKNKLRCEFFWIYFIISDLRWLAHFRIKMHGIDITVISIVNSPVV